MRVRLLRVRLLRGSHFLAQSPEFVVERLFTFQKFEFYSFSRYRPSSVCSCATVWSDAVAAFGSNSCRKSMPSGSFGAAISARD